MLTLDFPIVKFKKFMSNHCAQIQIYIHKIKLATSNTKNHAFV